MKGYWSDFKPWNSALTLVALLNMAAAIGYLIGGNYPMSLGCGAFSLACLAIERGNELIGRIRKLEDRDVRLR